MDKYLEFDLDDGTRVQIGVRINQELCNSNEFVYWTVGYRGDNKKFDEGGTLPIIPSSVDTLKQQLGGLEFPEHRFDDHVCLLLELLYRTTFSHELEMWNPLEPLPASSSGWVLVGVVDGLPWGFNIFSSQTKVFKEEKDVNILLDILGKIYTNTGRVFTRGFPPGIEPLEEPRFYFKMYYPQEKMLSACNRVLALGGTLCPPMVPLNLEPQKSMY